MERCRLLCWWYHKFLAQSGCCSHYLARDLLHPVLLPDRVRRARHRPEVWGIGRLVLCSPVTEDN